ncbi:putative signaling protein [Saliniradius amylolyticus]|uniref:diguanylate cyclase n=1 Tax=Saliniradius amylolyticus TaxID=2183582 RepID=A0A2S2E184_9ALTE|nr:GGDEF domain-containing protein [Saliniradius amylolyticus]AWL11415.1 putative signaling protein [Saliniradius amylolyticus]
MRPGSINNQWWSIGLILILMLPLSPLLAQPSTPAELLDEANRVRSQNPDKLDQLLAQVKPHVDSLSETQQANFEYLSAYNTAIHGQPQLAISDLEQLIQRIESNKDGAGQQLQRVSIRAKGTIVNLLANSKVDDWYRGLELIEELHQLVEPLSSDDQLFQMAYINTAIFYNHLEQYSLGLPYARAVTKANTSIRLQCFAYRLMLEAQLALGQLSVDSAEFSEGKAVCEQANEELPVQIFNGHQAKVYIDQQQYSQAIALLNQNLPVVESIGSKALISVFNSLLAKAYLETGALNQARTHAQKTLGLLEDYGNTESRIRAYEVLYQIARQRNQPAQALNYYEQYAQANQTYLDDIHARNMAYQLAVHKATQQQNKIELLNKENTLLRTRQILAQTEAENTRFAVLFLILAVLVLGLWLYKNHTTQKRLKALAERDSLTEISNRRHLLQAAKYALEYCKNTRQILGIVVFDLDKFKSINDRFGHATGDWVLKQVVATCQKVSRQSDIFARIGGEEFCFVLPGCDKEHCQNFAEECRRALEEVVIEEDGHRIRVTASFGVTDTQSSGYNLDKLIGVADKAMYNAKNKGRNQVVVATAQPATA